MDLKLVHWSPKLVNDVLPEVSEGHVPCPSTVRFTAEDSPVRFRRGRDVGGERRRNELRCGPSLVSVVESPDFRELDNAAHVGRVHRSGNGTVLVQRQMGS